MKDRIPPDYYRDAPLIKQVAVDVRNGIASPLAAALLESFAHFVEGAQAGFYDVVINELSQLPKSKSVEEAVVEQQEGKP